MRLIYQTDNFPILQNKVYLFEDDSKNCSRGEIVIAMDENGLISNIAFDEKKMVYDKDYDNSVPSSNFKNYYSKIGKYLVEKYSLDTDSFVLDIGCGKGTFLKQMYEEKIYGGKALGIDPSYEGELEPIQGRLKFIQEYFDAKHLDGVEKVSLVLLRHTLEHIPNPVGFLGYIFELFKKSRFENIPIFIEVPDVEWIFENKAYWDFFYEHVNYFSKSTLNNTILKAQGIPVKIQNEFNGQYQWAEAIINSKNDPSDHINLNFINKEYDVDFNKEIELIISRLKYIRRNYSKLVIWGMASKGIIYSLHLEKNGISVDYCVDVNPNKQNKFIPIIGNLIISPTLLPKDKILAIICMNPNYFEEINQTCKELNLN